jgi:hypothetical protein
MGWVGNTTLQMLHPWERDLVPIFQEAGLVSGQSGWSGTIQCHIVSKITVKLCSTVKCVGRNIPLI